MSAGADFSRNCMSCEHLRTELWPVRGGRGRESVAYRCFAPGPCRGYHMGTGLILPYVPAWCPKIEREKRAEGNPLAPEVV